ncbi:MAG: YidC/Oxa1 family membrane protein insertase [Acholeplasmataceae bacterium]|jgi:YidC/Oxa1 family membrane protein insertase
MKKRILLIITLLLMLTLGLSGCRRKPKPQYLVVSAPDVVVVDGTFNTYGLKVYRVYGSPLDKTGRTVELLTPGQYKTQEVEVPGDSNVTAGVTEYVITDKECNDPKDKKKPLQTSFKFVKKHVATEPIKERDSFLVFQYKEIIEAEKKPASYAFTHQMGQKLNEDDIAKYMNVIKVGPSADGTETIQTDVTNEVVADLKNSTPYKQGLYSVTLTSGSASETFEVMVAGGQKPIHDKSANWFDYILVIPVGWIMQLLSFGGIYALGIIFATIVIRTLAWPIYAKTNSMSSRMAEAQPDIQRIQNKYRGRTDRASQQQMQLETMQVYKKHKIGMGSMFLPFLQMPIFIAMYQTVTRILVPYGYWADKITNTKFLGIELSIGNHWTSYILAALVGATMILLQWLSQRKPKHLKKTVEHKKDEQAAQTAKTMKIVSYVMVAMMVIFSFQSNALALYWIVGNLFSLGQTLIHKEISRRQYEKKQEETLGGIL